MEIRGAIKVFGEEGLPPLKENAVRAMLIEHLGRLKYELFERDDEEGRNRFIEVVTKKSQGLPLYVRMVVEDLKAGKWTINDEDKLPEGLEAYFDDILERLRVSDVGSVLTPMFCLLAWAKEPLSDENIKYLLKTHHLSGSREWDDLVRKAFEQGHIMLQRQENRDGELGWAFYHESFREHLLGSDEVKLNLEWAQRRWLEVGKSWESLEKEEPSLFRYILRHYAEHLSDAVTSEGEAPAEPLQSLFDLARNEKFAQTQQKVLPHEPDLPLKTIQLALDAAIETDLPKEMAEMVLRHVLTIEIAETPLQAQRRGESERAIGLAKQWLERDYKLGTLWLLLLAWSWEVRGERELAKRCLKEISQWWQGKTLEKLGVWQSDTAKFLLGELVEVEGCAEVGLQVLRDEDLKDLAHQLARKGKFEKALEVAKGIEYAGGRSSALVAIVEEMAKIEMMERIKEVFEKAIEVVKGIEDAGYRSETLGEITVEIAKVGKFDEALEIAKGIEDAVERSWALSAIAGEMAKAGEFERALEVAKGIEGSLWRSWALREIAKEMAKTEMMERTKEVFDEAKEVAKEIEDAKGRSWALREIVGEMAKVGKFDEALEVAEGIEDAWRRSAALRAIAGEMAKVGMSERAKEVFEEAMEVAKGIEDAWWRSAALAEIAGEMAKAGEFDRALEVAKGIEDAWWRSGTLRAIAGEMAKAGMRERAEEAIKQAWEAAQQTASFYTLWEVAETAAEIGLTQKAIEFARQIAGERTWGLWRVLYALTGRGEKDGVKGLLALCGWAMETAIHACECLIRLYPSHVVSIAEVVHELAS